MNTCTRLALVCLCGLLSASTTLAQSVRTIRVVLPEQADAMTRNVAGVLARHIQQRCDARVSTAGEAPFTVEFAIAAELVPEGFRIEDRTEGGVRIVGNTARGLLYGVGKLLRTSRFGQDGFRPGAWRGMSTPEKQVRGIYFATHFHNFYHDAPVEEVQRYVEDIGLWGLNTLIVWYDMHHFHGFDSPEAIEFRQRLKAICRAARGVGLDVGFACVANEGYANSPEAIRADVKGMRGAAFPSDICTSKPAGSRYVLNNFAQLYDWAADLEPKWVMIWPYDSGGCGCAQCQPWGYGGYLRCARPLAELARTKFPGARVMLSTWFLDGDEWAGLANEFSSRPDWADFLMVEPAFLPHVSNSPPAHPAPGGLPLVGFPEISMVGWPVWGGFGANPLPTRYEREWSELKEQWNGGCPYSEGIFEDINKVLFARFYWKADTTADETLREYIAFEYSPDVVDLVLPAIHLLEKNVPNGQIGPGSLQARKLLEQADSQLTPQARQSWRWRILFLRAQVDAQLFLSRGALQGQVLYDAFQELTRIYHAENAEPAVKPPQVDPTLLPAIDRPTDLRGPEITETYAQTISSARPIAYWNMQQVAKDSLDDASGHEHQASIEAGVEVSQSAGEAPANPAAVFWGGRISAAISQLSDDYSVELWLRNELRPDVRPITAYLFSRGIDGSQGRDQGDHLGIGGTHDSVNQGKLLFFNGTKHNQVLSGSTDLQPGTWHHVVLVRQGRDVSVYLDGRRTPEISGQVEIGYSAGCRQLFFGGRSDGFAPLDGMLDEVSVYDRALGVEEIAAHYAAALPRTETEEQDSASIPDQDNDGDPLVPEGAAAEPRAVSPESVAYLQALRKNTPFGTDGFDLTGLRAGMGTRREPGLPGVRLVPVKVDGIPSEWVVAPGANPDHRLLYLHGGGFVSGSGAFYLALAAHLSQAAQCAVLLPDYRLAPEHPFPAGLEDCVRAHEWLQNNGPEGPSAAKATMIAGDSAGGNLTLATLLALRDRQQPLPVCGIAISPCTDFTLSSASMRTVDDPILSAKTMPVFRDYYLGKSDPHDPLASPVFGDYRGLPPLLIQVGEHEMLRDDGVRVAEKARHDGTSVRLEIWKGMFHVFQSHEPLLPEAREAIDSAAAFIRRSLPR